MHDPNETIEEALDVASLHCLRRTRSAVLNVLIGVALVVAGSGLLLRTRPAGARPDLASKLNQALLAALFVLFAFSTLLRRVLGRRARLDDPRSRWARFYWGHVLPALVGALAAPLGLAHGWLVSPRVETIFPFWLTALLLGILAYPRGYELEGYAAPMAWDEVPGR
ncbi:hypothetical protein OJF2_24160 [Aquisphaera giovannonii]|uniref:Uncharacterized protein n=1 Tax=Aquisphaera giovannonii TaxID=406548 RepID=A0A5B9W0Y7_9BACT|nr:hypothetical protein [Aquisphaera giovannonii]QEH33884.1 hypothetical protein OJF2_24160 [Aquisphaera giovannonii]